MNFIETYNLNGFTKENTALFSLNNQIMNAKVVDVDSEDLITLGFYLYEINPVLMKCRLSKRKEGLLNQIVKIKCGEFDNEGVLLVEIVK